MINSVVGCLALCFMQILFFRTEAFSSIPTCFVKSKEASAAGNPDPALTTCWSAVDESVAGDTVQDDLSIDAGLRDSLKRSLLQFGASYDRGYGATESARQKVEELLSDLEKLNPEADASRGILGSSAQNTDPSPLQGIWRMVWTTAQDVLVLAASPVFTVGAIYQVFEPPVVTNIIDFIPKAQSLFPPKLVPPSLIRAEVTTRASSRANQPMRIGLDFEKVKLQPVEFLGVDVDGFLPPLGFDLPRIPGIDPETSPGYFDVKYLDSELLVIQQNAPGGIFVLVKVLSKDP